MPRGAPRACVVAGCRQLIPRGKRCPEHGKFVRPVLRNPARNAERQRMYGPEWNAASKAHLMRNPVCVRCLRDGRSVSASVTDHATPHRGDWELFWNPANWQSLCKTCHDRKTWTEDVSPRVRPEDLPTPACDVTLVCGAPMSGKTTFVIKAAAPDDIVIDEPAPDDLDALRRRNDALSLLAHQPAKKRAWVVMAAPIKDRLWWVRKLNPSRVVVMSTSRAECEARARAAASHGAPHAARTLGRINTWWRAEVGA